MLERLRKLVVDVDKFQPWVIVISFLCFVFQAMDTDTGTGTVWVDCWLVEQLLQQLLMALTILLMHVHLGSAMENSNMGSSNMENLVSVGSMEA